MSTVEKTSEAKDNWRKLILECFQGQTEVNKLLLENIEELDRRISELEKKHE